MKARIYQPAKTAMQSGKGKTRRWVLEFEQVSPRFVEPVMGWTGSSDMTQELKLTFDTEAEAVAYAKRKNIEYDLLEPNEVTIRPKSYADNFLK